MISNETTPCKRPQSTVARIMALASVCLAAFLIATLPASSQDATPGTDTGTAAAPATAAPGPATETQPSDQADGPDDEEDELDAAEAMVKTPLAPAPTSSPRETLRSLRSLAQGAAHSLMDAFEQSAQDNTLLDSDESLALKRQAMLQLDRAATTFDLSAVPPANRRTVAISAILQLEEILKRIEVPDLDEIPAKGDVEAGTVANGWTIPGTEIRMARVETASGEQRFLFSPETVARLPTFYSMVRDMPRDGVYDIDFYQHFVSAPGLSMPTELYRYVLEFPPWLLAVHYEQAMWQWLALIAISAFFTGVLCLILRVESRIRHPQGALLSSLRRLISPIFVLVLLAIYGWIIDDVINLTGSVLATMELVVTSLQVLTFAAIAVVLANVLAALIISSPRIRSESLDASLIRLVLRVLGFVVAGFILFQGATNVGLPAYGVVAGLGVGGLAIALAVRPTLENFIGGIILYADRPVKVGDFCKFGDMLGTVEEIGLRSTKVRSLDRTLVTVQNSEFSQMSITNFTRRDSNLMQTTIRLRYETPPDALTGIIDNIAQMLRNDPHVDADTVRVCFRAFGTFSLDVEIWCYVMTPEWGKFLKIQEDLYLKIMQIVDAGGSSFALPSQTTYLGTDRAPGAGDDTETPSPGALSGALASPV